MFEIEVADAMPIVRRGKRKSISPEKLQLMEALQSGKVNVLKNIDTDSYNNLQQRIRLAGKDVDLKVSVHKVVISDEKVDIYFEGFKER